jgi:misacylated tRNA(Ala) deacylase
MLEKELCPGCISRPASRKSRDAIRSVRLLTERLFWQDAYLREFDARVESVDEKGIRLDRTAFNPRGGGLVSDIGKLGGMDVTEVVKIDEEIYHMVSGGPSPAPSSSPPPSPLPLPLRPGDTVHGVIDWDRRHRIMRMHTTAHILSAVVNRETGALITGNQISPAESRIDFSLEAFDRERFGGYVRMANDAARGGAEVKSFFMKREEALETPGFVKLANALPPAVDELRIVQIGEIDTQADGGVHVKNTSEIGEIVVNRIENKGKSNRRLYFSLKP